MKTSSDPILNRHLPSAARRPMLRVACSVPGIMRMVPLLLLLALVRPAAAQGYRQQISLAGEWQTPLGTVSLPGTTDTNRKGTPLQKRDETTHLSRLYSFTGTLEYTRQVDIPKSWKGKIIRLRLERTKPATVFVDGAKVGTSDDISTEQVYDLSRCLAPGRHTLTIAVDNTAQTVPPQIIDNSHAYCEDTQTNWNGIIGNILLEAVNPTHIANIAVVTHPQERAFEATITVEGAIKKKSALRLILAPWGSDYGTVVAETTLKKGKTQKNSVVLRYRNDSLRLWDEFHPNLYRLLVELEGNDLQEADFGLVDFSARGQQFVVNGRPTFLRGKHDACVFPYTGHVPMDLASWRRYLQICKGYGINHLRFHSWCPPEAAFLAADIEGVYLQPELPFWGDFKKDDRRLMTFLHKEGQHIIRQYGHHPSFVMMALGNELWGDVPSMQRFIETFRKLAPTKLFTLGSNYYLGYEGVKPGMDYFTTCRMKGEAWGDYSTHTRGSFSFADVSDGGIINHFRPNSSQNFDQSIGNCPIPVISHETGQFQTYPDYDEIGKYSGVLYPCNFEVFRHRLDSAGMADQAKAFHRASGKWSVQLYKQDIEMDLRTQRMAGFQLLDIQDYPGQGTALVGILDAFMESKGLVTPNEWRQWCSPVVPLAILPKYCFESDETVDFGLQVANYGADDLQGKSLCWQITDEQGSVIATDSTALSPGYGLIDGGHASVRCSADRARSIRLTLYIPGTDHRNSWPLWIYPAGVRPDSRGIVVTPTLHAAVMKRLEAGATVLFMPDSTAGGLRAAGIDTTLTVGGLFQTDYWNYRMFKSYSERNGHEVSPGTLGILTDARHPMLSDFPTDDHTSWQWFPIVKYSRPFVLDNTPAAYRPVVQVIDNVERNHKLGLIFEFRVGRGRLLVCQSPLHQLQRYPEARQLYASILNYMRSDDFAPKTTISSQQLRLLLTTPVHEGKLKKLFSVTEY